MFPGREGKPLLQRLLSAFLGLVLVAAAQTPTLVKGTPPPTYILYQILFHQIMALETQANALDASAKVGGADLRASFQKQLGLSDTDTALFKVVAGTCVAQLDAEDAKAMKTIATAKASVQAAQPAQQSAIASATISQLGTFETERTAISNGCIQNLQHNVSAKAFARVDLYVSSVIGSKTHPIAVATAATGPGATAGSAVKQ